jgi:hypothetical protein
MFQTAAIILAKSWKNYAKEIDDLAIFLAIFSPLLIWGIYALRKRRWSTRLIILLMLAQAIALGVAGTALLQDLFNWQS